MIALGHAAILACIALGVVLFRVYPGHRLVIGVYVVGVLFLPEFGAAGYVEGVPPPLGTPGIQLTKPNAIALGLLAGSLLFDRRRWFAGRPRWFDLPMLAWCFGPVVSSVTNAVWYDDPVSRNAPSGGGSGAAASWLASTDLYDGIVRSLDVVFTWGVPYCLGRLYVTDLQKLRELVLWMVLGGVLYLPLCVVEMAISPQLHRFVYGFHQHEFHQTIRLTGYRPVVFLEHGLAVGFWMMAVALAAGWLWLAGPLRTVPGLRGQVSGLVVVIPLGLTAVACKSTGALVLGLFGLAVLGAAWAAKRPAPVLVLLCAAPLYVGVRMARVWEVEDIAAVVGRFVNADRAASLEFRLWNEEMLVDKAMERPLVGWGGWGRSKIYDRAGKPITIADGLWIVTIGERGLLGLITLGFVLLLPLARLIAVHGRVLWTQGAAAPAAVAGVIVGLYSLDCLMNAMVNPIFILLLGGLIAIPTAAKTTAPTGSSIAGSWRIRPPRPVTRVVPARVASRVSSRPNGQQCRRR